MLEYCLEWNAATPWAMGHLIYGRFLKKYPAHHIKFVEFSESNIEFVLLNEFK